MALTSLPKVGTGEALGPIKSNARAVVDIKKESDAAEWNAAAAALQAVCETVGLSDGSTPGSIESERLRNASEIGGALADSDHLLVSDASDTTDHATGTVKKALLTRIGTWLLGWAPWLARSRVDAVRAPATIACLGDSITAINVESNAELGPFTNYHGRGYLTWANIYTGQRFAFSPDLNFGVAGDTTEHMLARIDDVTAAAPDICVVLAGTNDRTERYTLARSIAALQSIYETLTAAGILVVACPVWPRSEWGDLDAGEIVDHRRMTYALNRWIRRYSTENPGVLLADATPAMTDAADSLGDPLSDMLHSDGLHPAMKAAQAQGAAIAATLEGIGGVRSMLPSHNLDVYDADYNPQGNLIDNGSMQGTGGSVLGPATGTAADGWVVHRLSGSGGSGTAVASKEARADGVNGSLQVITLTDIAGGATSPADVYSAFVDVLGSSGSYAQGDLIEAECEVFVSGGVLLNAVTLGVREMDSSGTNQATAYCNPKLGITNYTTAEWSGILRTPRITIENAVTVTSKIRVRIDIPVNGASSGASAVVKIGRVDVRKVAA